MSAEDSSDKPLHMLEEQLVRQKAILANRILVQKLPDKGAKIQASVVKLEAEVDKRRKEAATKKAHMSPKDVEEMEWALGSRSVSFLRSQLSSVTDSKVSQDGKEADDEEEEDMDDDDAVNPPDPLKIIASSQISQRRAKPVFDKPSGGQEAVDRSLKGGGESHLDRFSTRIVKTDSKRPKEDTKFVPNSNKMAKKPSGSSSPAGSTTSNASKHDQGSKKWDEVLLPPNLSFEPAKLLSMEDTIKIESEKLKQVEVQKTLAPPKKVYAYDKLKEQGLLGSYTVQMQTSRPVHTDADEDDLDEDLSDDQITEESDSDDAVEEPSSNQKRSQDLSELVNTHLKLK